MKLLNPELKVTGIGNIAQDWKLNKLQEITHRIIDGTHFTPTYVKEGIPFLRVTDIQNEQINWDNIKRIPNSEHLELTKRCKPEKGDVLLSKNGTIGITKIVDWEEDFSIFVSLCLIKPNHQKINNQFLTYVLRSPICRDQMDLRSKQGTVINLHLEEIRELLIPTPQIVEQQKIASILSKVDELIQKAEQITQQTQIVRKGLMQRLLTRGIGHDKFKKTKFGKIPEEWKLCKISDIAELIMGQSPPGNSYNSANLGIPLLNGPTEFGIEYPTPIQFTTRPTKLCQREDILLCVRGSTTGRLNLSDREYCIGRGLAAIRGLKGKTFTKWLYYHFVKLQNSIYNIASGGVFHFLESNSSLLYNHLKNLLKIICLAL